MKIVFQNTVLPPEIGGTGIETVHLAEELGKRGHTVRVVGLTVDGAIGGENWELCPIPKAQSIPAKVRQLRRTLRDQSEWADAAIVQGGSFYGWWAARSVRSCPLLIRIPNSFVWEIAWEHGWIEHVDPIQAERQKWPPQMMLLQWMNRSYLRRAARIVVHSDYARSWIAEARIEDERVAPIPCGISHSAGPSPEDVEAARADLAPDGAPLLCAVGKLGSVKRFDRLVNVVARLPQTRGVLVGDGELRRDLERKVEELGCASRFTFTGGLPNAEALAVIAASDALVITSDMEAFGIISVEAMAVGTAVVAFGLCALPETLDGGRTGYIVEPGDDEGLRETVRYAIEHPEETVRKVEAAREHVKRYEWRNLAAEWEELLENVLGEDAS